MATQIFMLCQNALGLFAYLLIFSISSVVYCMCKRFTSTKQYSS